jgi:hypothetical protein
MAARIVITTIGGGMLIGIAAATIAFGGAATASADGLTCQSGCTVDYDGTQGSFDSSGTRGISRGLTTQSTDGHSIVSDACAITSKGCAPGASDPSTISATSGTSDDPDSALDADGYQAAAVR